MDTDSLTSGNYIYRINYEKIFSYTRPNENCHVKSDSVDGNRVSIVLMSSERVKTVKKETGVLSHPRGDMSSVPRTLRRKVSVPGRFSGGARATTAATVV